MRRSFIGVTFRQKLTHVLHRNKHILRNLISLFVSVCNSFMHLFSCLFICLFVHLFIYLYIYIRMYSFIYVYLLYVYLYLFRPICVFDMIYLLTTIGLPPGGSSTVHIYTQRIHRTTQ
jgi:hypothetical protein